MQHDTGVQFYCRVHKYKAYFCSQPEGSEPQARAHLDQSRARRGPSNLRTVSWQASVSSCRYSLSCRHGHAALSWRSLCVGAAQWVVVANSRRRVAPKRLVVSVHVVFEVFKVAFEFKAENFGLPFAML